MKKQKHSSEIFKENIKSAISSRYIPTEQELFSSQKFTTTGKIIRDIGQECFNSAQTNVWGKINGLGEKMKLLDDKEIQDSQSLLVLGFGDADNNSWYGAGPTRDMRRAYYTPMLLVLQPNVNIGQKSFLSKKNSEYANQFAKSINLLDLPGLNPYHYSQNNNLTTLIEDNISISNKEKAIFRVFAANLRKLNSNYFCDLGILLKSSQISGHYFLPPEIRSGSPLYGPLSLALGGKEKLMQGSVKSLYEFLDNKFNEFKSVTEKLPIQERNKFFPMVYVYNS